MAATRTWRLWGSTCSATSCGQGLPGVEHQWRSGLGITADGALIYAAGPDLAPLQLAQLLIRAGAVRAMELDINPAWPVFASYAPASPDGPAAPSNGRKLLASSTTARTRSSLLRGPVISSRCRPAQPDQRPADHGLAGGSA